MLVVALDVGTSSARARAFDAEGRALRGADGHVAYEPAATADGGVELDAPALVSASAAALDRCLAGLGARAKQTAADPLFRDRGHCCAALRRSNEPAETCRCV